MRVFTAWWLLPLALVVEAIALATGALAPGDASVVVREVAAFAVLVALLGSAIALFTEHWRRGGRRLHTRYAGILVALPIVGWLYIYPPELYPLTTLQYAVTVIGVIATTVGLFVIMRRGSRIETAVVAFAYIVSVVSWFAAAYYLGTHVQIAAFTIGPAGVPGATAPIVVGALSPLQAWYVSVRGFIGGNFAEFAPADDGARFLALLQLATLVVVTTWVLGLMPLVGRGADRGQEIDGDDHGAQGPKSQPVEPTHPPSGSPQTAPAASAVEPPRSIDLLWQMGLALTAQQHDRMGALDGKLMPLLTFGLAGLGFIYTQPVKLAFEVRASVSVVLVIGLVATMMGAWPRSVAQAPKYDALVKSARLAPENLKETFVGNFIADIARNEAVLANKVLWLKLAFLADLAALLSTGAVIMWTK